MISLSFLYIHTPILSRSLPLSSFLPHFALLSTQFTRPPCHLPFTSSFTLLHVLPIILLVTDRYTLSHPTHIRFIHQFNSIQSYCLNQLALVTLPAHILTHPSFSSTPQSLIPTFGNHSYKDHIVITYTPISLNFPFKTAPGRHIIHQSNINVTLPSHPRESVKLTRLIQYYHPNQHDPFFQTTTTHFIPSTAAPTIIKPQG